MDLVYQAGYLNPSCYLPPGPEKIKDILEEIRKKL
jgi:hypothetical protein